MSPLDSMLVKYSNFLYFSYNIIFNRSYITFILEYVGLEKWYCEKVCMKDKCNMVCVKPVTNEGLFSKYSFNFLSFYKIYHLTLEQKSSSTLSCSVSAILYIYILIWSLSFVLV